MAKGVKKQPLQPASVSDTTEHLHPHNQIIESANGRVIVSVLDVEGHEYDHFETSQAQFNKTYIKFPGKYAVKKN